jgi:3'(2'), 5'-bisphosphate nucleotidase
MTAAIYSYWVDPIISLAERAAATILAARARGIETLTKPDGSPQTNADREAEAVIIAGLRTITPHIPIVAEESASGQAAVDPTQPFWLVDPLDGTKSFVAGVDDFSVNIGLIVNTRPVFGVIYAPALGELFWNDATHAWYRRDGATAEKIRTRQRPAAGITLITNRTPAGAKLRNFLQPYNVVEQIRLSGAVKYGYLAMGRGDLYPRLGTTMEWDNAAGEAIVHTAGGIVTDATGAPLQYGQAHLTHHGVVGWGAPTIIS